LWRIKTKEEFIQEFGKRWRSTLPSKCNFPEEMDFLLGQRLTGTFSKSFLLEIKTNRFGTDLSFLTLRGGYRTMEYITGYDYFRSSIAFYSKR
jgi:hypothetical protein